MFTQPVQTTPTNNISFNGNAKQTMFSGDIIQLPANTLERSPLQDMFIKSNTPNHPVSFNGYTVTESPQLPAAGIIGSEMPRLRMYG